MGLSPKSNDSLKFQAEIELLRSELKQLSADHEVTKRNILILDKQVKEINAVNEILLSLQQQLLEEMIPQYGKTSNPSAVAVFPLNTGVPDDDDWN
tara:strand:- start:260 stop:547 length:288 start_codon:yes stop_codon:yes gene_type:complete